MHLQQMDTDFIGNREYRQISSMDTNMWDLQSSDPDLSEILDHVIEIAPEGIAEMTSLLNKVESQSLNNEKLAIKSIQESLMSIESDVNSTSSNMVAGIHATPPAYSTAVSLEKKIFNLFIE